MIFPKKTETAEAASREMVDFMKALFMRDKVGERFRGHVSGVANFGIFVELEEVFVEGMAPLEFMTDDYYRFIPEEHAVLGRRTGRRFRLGRPRHRAGGRRGFGVAPRHLSATGGRYEGGGRRCARLTPSRRAQRYAPPREEEGPGSPA